MNFLKAILSAVCVAFLVVGCNSYITRTFWQSVSSIGDPIPPAPHLITSPVIENANLAVGWIGHATALVQIHDKIFLTDPLLTKTIGMLIKRAVMPGIDPALLTKVDYILISHVHFDHLSFGSLEMLPKNAILLYPEGLSSYIPDFGFQDVDEMKTWDVFERDSVRITAVPAQHFNGRYGFDRGWIGNLGYTGYVFEYRGIAVFFGGDTGYDPEVFKEVGRRFKIDLAIVPIAPGSNEGLGSYVHVNPSGALQIFKDLGARFMMPIHFGTMMFGSKANPNAPLVRLRALAAEQGISDRIIGLEVGEQRILF